MKIEKAAQRMSTAKELLPCRYPDVCVPDHIIGCPANVWPDVEPAIHEAWREGYIEGLHEAVAIGSLAGIEKRLKFVREQEKKLGGKAGPQRHHVRRPKSQE
jgi:hypothetical protein